MLELTNTLSGKKEIFNPIESKRVKIYTCGMTVQDSCHLGHLRTFIFADLLRRFLEYLGKEVIFVMNFTDIDDKIINKAREENRDYRIITQRYIDEFLLVAEKLNLRQANDIYPRATQHIPEMIELVERLLGRGLAYISEGDVYFDITRFPAYGKLSKKKIEDLIAGARVEVGEKKRNPLDFVLWKGYKEGEPYWYAPFGRGRPGWHLECSAMSMHYLGETFDIHIGGEDLIFPHHENEIAQSEGATGKPFVNYWLHNALLLFRGEKMAKSTKNYFLASEALKHYHPNVIRLFLLKAHYKSPYEFTIERLEEAKSQYQRLEEFLSLCEKGKPRVSFKNPPEGFVSALLSDLNTPKALGEIFKLVEERFKAKEISPEENERLYSSVLSALNILGFKTEKKDRWEVFWEEGTLAPTRLEPRSPIPDEMLLIKARECARKNKRYDIADKIRTAFIKFGYELRDTKEGVDIIRRSDCPSEPELFLQLLRELKKELNEEKELDKEERKPYLSEIIDLMEKAIPPDETC
uniref:Cysteine--tRNA ligase n=1 Tax=candidate division WOR-3 bacterium TaxID=2052148 RepID=A0A7C3UR05_UNCW3